MGGGKMVRKVSKKLIFLGSMSVGKTCMLYRLTHNEFLETIDPTIGAEYSHYTVDREGYSISFEIWDTAGHERYRSLSRMYYRNARAAIIVYSVLERKTFDDLSNFLLALQEEDPEPVITVIVGNKADNATGRVVSYEEGKSFAEANGCMFFESSARTNMNIREIFEYIADEMTKQPGLYLEEQDAHDTVSISPRRPRHRC